MSRIKPGDIFSISTSKGKACLHYICKDKEETPLVRVLPGLFEVVPDDLEALVLKEELFLFSFSWSPLTIEY